MMTFAEALEKVFHHVHKQTEFQEKLMADVTKLQASFDALKAKVEAYIAKTNVPPPPDDQPAIDAVQSDLDALTAEIPSA